MKNFKLDRKIKAVFIDVDGTITLKNNFQFHPKVTDLLKKAQEKQIHIIISTGREVWNVKKMHKHYSHNEYSRYIISTAGAAIVDMKEDKIYSDKKIQISELKKLVNYCIDKKLNFFLDEKNTIYSAKNKIEILRHNLRFSKKHWFIYKMKSHGKQILNDNIHKFSIFEEKMNMEETRKIYKEISKKHPTLEVVVVKNGLVEMTVKGVNKGSAVKSICKNILKINPSNTIAIGDSMNDISMLKVVGIPIAMGNAMPEVKKVAKYITKSYEELGVCEVISKII